MDLVHLATENLTQITGNLITWLDKEPQDGVLEFTCNEVVHTFSLVIKQEVRPHQLQEINAYFKDNEHSLLLAAYLSPSLKSELRLQGISYLEASGNAFLIKKGLFLFVDTQKPLVFKKNKGNRAFTKTGLKVLFLLLQHQDAIHLTHRELAAKANVGLGNIPQVLNGLKSTGFLLPLDRASFILDNKKILLDRWVAEYATILRPKLFKDKYFLKSDWQSLAMDDNDTVWGGEPAADLLTNHLRPEKLLLYSRRTRQDLIKKYGLMPHPDGNVEVLEMFWNGSGGNTAPPLLVYTDLIINGGKRNREAAEKIYDEYLKSII